MGDKRSGNTRATNPTKQAIDEAVANFYAQMATGNYDKDKSFVNHETGGYLLYAKDRTMDNMEYNAATFMAMKGYPIIMTPEGKDGYELMIDAQGHKRFGDGRIGFTIHDDSYEQRSPKAESEATARVTVENAINHARKKNADIAVIFDYSRSFKPEDIKHGIEHYEREYSRYRFYSVKDVIVVSGSGNVHEWEIGKRK